MKTSTSLRKAWWLAILAFCLGHAAAAPYGPDGRATTFVQPDGEKLELRVFGDEYYARTETADGHTVVYDKSKGSYHYAVLRPDGGGFLAGARVGGKVPEGLPKHLDLSKKSIREIVRAKRETLDGGRQERWMRRVQSAGRAAQARDVQGAPVLGEKRGLTILAQFPDDPNQSGNNGVDFPTTPAKITNFCNLEGYKENGNSGSVRDYFFDQSLGRVTYTQTVTQIITLPRPRAFYNYSNYPTNTIVRPDAGTTGRLLLTDAIQVLVAEGFDFSSLTVDETGNAIATNIFFAGQDSGVFAAGLWPHQYFLAAGINVGTPAAPIRIFNYQITNIENAAPVIGTFCHENGHLLLDYPDIYDLDGEGVGEHCLMGSGNFSNQGRTPSPINVHFKDLVGWANVTEILASDFRTVSLPTTGNVAYRIRKPGSLTESFIAENRGEGDIWAKHVRDKGIAIWHIDEEIQGNIRGEHYGVALEQADGRFDLEIGRNRGDTGDLFDIGDARFNNNSTPNSKWWDGEASSIRIRVLGAVSQSTQVLFGAVPPDTIILGSPNGGEVVFPGSTFKISWEANITGNVKIELLKGGLPISVIAASEANDGEFSWKVAAGLSEGADYAVRITSVSNAVPASDTSEAPFSVNSATFPGGGTMPYGWYKPKSAHVSWEVTDSSVYEGNLSLSPKTTGDGQRAGVAYRSIFKDGFISFYVKASSEEKYDVGRFYIDGAVQRLGDGEIGNGLSGKSGWIFCKYPVSAGKHTFMWTYEKDDSYKALQDTVWLDGVTLPSTTQEIAVEKSGGTDLVSGSSTLDFPNTRVKESSKAVVLTIRNTGKSDLYGMKVSAYGSDAKLFTVSPLKKTALSPGGTTTVEVVFNPTSMGSKLAKIRIFSNDDDEPEFRINLAGNATGVPEMQLAHKSVAIASPGNVDFGKAAIRKSGKARTFTISNGGSADLKIESIKASGAAAAEFAVSGPDELVVKPGFSTTFRVAFNPLERDLRKARIRIVTNTQAGSFEMVVTGTGVAKKTAARDVQLTAVFENAFNVPAASRSVEVLDGNKYLALTVGKPPGSAASGIVEVSSDLLEWYSGDLHTTILIDDATTLKVRDNTPVTPDTKRYIRLK